MTLSGVSRRTRARVGPDAERRVTFDTAVCTKWLASAADAAHYLWSFNLRASIGKAWLA